MKITKVRHKSNLTSDETDDTMDPQGFPLWALYHGFKHIKTQKATNEHEK